MDILQINLNHCRLAHYLLVQTASELKANIVFIAEPLYNPGSWLYSKKGNAAIWTRDLEGNKRQEDGDVIGEDFVAIKVNRETYVSIYLSPNINIEEYAYRLGILSEFIREERTKGRRICVGGDFNAKSPSWGSNWQDDRGSILLDRLLEWGMTPIKPDGGHTYEKGQVKSNLDFLALTRNMTTGRDIKTKIMDTESASDHRYLLTRLKIVNNDVNKNTNTYSFRWKVTKTGLEKLIEVADEILKEERMETQSKFCEEEEKRFLEILPEACEKAFEKIEVGGGKKAKTNIWWNDDIKDQRNKTNKMRRKLQRYRKKENWDMEEIMKYLYKKSKRVLQRMIRKEKDKKWRELCESINKDPWGKPYKTVLRQVKPDSPPANISLEMAEKVLQELFPQEERRRITSEGGNMRTVRGERRQRTLLNYFETREQNEEIPEITEEEIVKAAKNLKPNKAPGLDGIIPEIIKKIAEARPDRLRALFNGIIERGKIPKDWKKARTILLRKPGKDPTEPSAYRPICVIDAIAKLMEYILRDRLEKELGGGFDENQFGFVKGKSTVHAMYKVVEDIRAASDKQRFGVIIALDVRNAFNTLNWEVIIEQLKERGFSKYLIRLIQDYFKGRKICYRNSENEIWKDMKMGVPQGSVLGPFLWNLVYDDLLKRENTSLTSKYAFADDIILTVQASTTLGLKTRSESTIEDVRRWMATKGLALAEQKTEMMRMNRKRMEEGFEIQIGGMKVKPSPQLKYLGVIFDESKKYRIHIEEATNKAIRTMTALSSLMTNGIRTSQAVRRLFYMTLESVVLYGAPGWAEGVDLSRNRTLLKKTQKLGLGRVVSAYRSVPQETLCVLAGVPPWHLKIRERKQLFELENAVLNEENINRIKVCSREGRSLGEVHLVLEGLRVETEDGEEEDESLKKEIKKWIRKKMKQVTDNLWQEEWEQGVVGRWTYRLIPNIVNWKKRKHGQLDFHMTQILTGHGVFSTFRKKIGKADSDECWYHRDRPDNPEHTVTECDEWEEERREMLRVMKIQRTNLTVEKLLEESIKKEENWRAFEVFCRKVMKRKEEEERRRERTTTGDNPVTRDSQRDPESGD